MTFPSIHAASEKSSQQTFLAHIVDKPNPVWKGRLVVIWSGKGEYTWAERIQTACGKLGWQCLISNDPASVVDKVETSDYYDEVLRVKPPTAEEVKRLIEKFDPDCVISLKWNRIYSKKHPTYLSVSGVFKGLMDPSTKDLSDLPFEDSSPTQSGVLDAPRKLLEFKGFLHTTKIEKIKQHWSDRTKKKCPSMRWFPSMWSTEFSAPFPRKIFYCGFQWDPLRNTEEYTTLFSLLSKHDLIDIYGPPEKWEFARNSLKGKKFLQNSEFIYAMRQCGIYLALHTKQNLDLAAPSSRVFEAAAAGCVIICDKHPFIMETFGNSLFYIDPIGRGKNEFTGDKSFSQIKEYVNWILANPKEAQLMAMRAHAIFSAKFTLEKQLEKLKALHLFTLGEDRKVGNHT